MNLAAYLNRIGFDGTPAVDLETLKQVHRQHLLALPYENIDVQLERTLDLDLQRIFDKIVNQGRGGWCYEMNGLLGWALTEIGFDVMRMNGGVRREEMGDFQLGNHLVLRVQLDEPWLADTGFGDGAIEPIPIKPGSHNQRGFEFRLAEVDGYWRFENHKNGGAKSFDFKMEQADEALFAEKCQWLSTAEESPFVMALICQRFVPGGYSIQLGKLARQVTPDGVKEWLLNSPEELCDRLVTEFGLDVPEVASLWSKIEARHTQLFGPSD